MPTYNLESLFNTIIQSPATDITAALNKDKSHASLLSEAMCAFRNAVKLKRETVGLHYNHYATLIQAFDLRHERKEELSDSDANYSKCDLVWRQIIGLLQLNLPTPDRVRFAQAFHDEERTVNYKYIVGAFPDTPVDADWIDSGVGFDVAMYGCAVSGSQGVMTAWKTHVKEKISNLQNLCSPDLGINLRRA